MPDDELAWAAELALELRRRVKEQQATIGAAEFGKVELAYRIGDRAERVVHCDESVQHRLRAEVDRDPAQRDSDLLPEPDPAEVKSSVGANAADYVVGDVIDGRFEILDGTPPYQAPEASLTRWDVSTHLFAVGVLPYELLCNGQHPTPAPSPWSARP